eukprot:6073120-Pleurochrysis_carterae.AAC.1
MASYPDVDNDPGLDQWLDLEEWKHEKVFQDITKKWKFKTANKQSEVWAALQQWHAAHNDSSSIVLGTPVIVAPDCELRSTLYPWRQMWQILRRHAITGGTAPSQSAPAALVDAASAGSQPARLSNNTHRQHLSTATRASVLNTVRFPEMQDRDVHRMRLREDLQLG